MTTHRSYRPAMSLEAAIAELHANAGTQFDPDVVAATVRVLLDGDIAPHPQTAILAVAGAAAAGA